jgi:hypothetical protein
MELLPYWIEHSKDSTGYVIYTKVPKIPANSSVTLYIKRVDDDSVPPKDFSIIGFRFDFSSVSYMDYTELQQYFDLVKVWYDDDIEDYTNDQWYIENGILHWPNPDYSWKPALAVKQQYMTSGDFEYIIRAKLNSSNNNNLISLWNDNSEERLSVIYSDCWWEDAWTGEKHYSGTDVITQIGDDWNWDEYENPLITGDRVEYRVVRKDGKVSIYLIDIASGNITTIVENADFTDTVRPLLRSGYSNVQFEYLEWRNCSLIDPSLRVPLDGWWKITIQNPTSTDWTNKVVVIDGAGIVLSEDDKLIVTTDNPFESVSGPPKVFARLTVRPNCVCYRNSESEKDVRFSLELNNVIIQPPVPAKWIARLYEVSSNEVLAEKELQFTPDTLDYTFNLEENSKKDYIIKLICNINGTEYEVDSETIIVERQQYCHSLTIDVKTFDKTGEETTEFPHPTSADYDENKHSEIIVRFKIKDEQGNSVDVPIENISVNWQYPINKTDIGTYEMRIPNTADNCLNIGEYGIAIYINKNWCNENGYYNKYNIEASDVILNADKIEKVGLWNNEHITNYENGITYLDTTYETISGIFINPQKQFSIVESLTETTERRQYSYCFRIYESPMTLNLPTYNEDELRELAKAIVRELGQPRKIETFTLLTKEIPKINSSITLDYNGKLISIPVYSVKFFIAKKTIRIQIKNDQMKLLKDYLRSIR